MALACGLVACGGDASSPAARTDALDGRLCARRCSRARRSRPRASGVRLRDGRLRAARGATSGGRALRHPARPVAPVPRCRSASTMPRPSRTAATYTSSVATTARATSRRGGLAFRYNPRRDRWRGCRPRPRGAPRWRPGSVGGKPLRGRRRHAGGALTTLEVYDFRRRRWTRGPDMGRRASTSRARSRAAPSTCSPGAWGARATSSAERYVPVLAGGSSCPTCASRAAGSARPPSAAEFWPAARRPGTIGEVEAYDPRDRRWSPCPDAHPRHGLGVVSRGHRVFAIEGGPEPGFHFTRDARVLDLR